MNNDRDTFLELRSFYFDGNDPFMTNGHQILKIRQGNRKIPAWAKDKRKIQAILLRSFPKLRTDVHQRARAARWMAIIQLYFRVQMTRSQVAAETKLPPNVVKMLIRNISRAASGLPSYGTKKRTGNPNGRPKKVR